MQRGMTLTNGSPEIPVRFTPINKINPIIASENTETQLLFSTMHHMND